MEKTSKILLTSICMAGILSLFSFDLPEGWFVAGSEPESYEMGKDPGSGPDGGNAATIQSSKDKIKGFGTLMQTAQPGKYLGKRVRMKGSLKTKDVDRWAGFWFRVDGKNSDNSLAFDNMHDGKRNRSVKGSTGWTEYEIVLDVPSDASKLAYGALLVGTGQIWFDDITFEIVDKSVPTTGRDKSSNMPNESPVNLNFED